MDRIRERLALEPRLAFTSLFEPDMIRSQMVGIFLAILELIRHHHIQVEQDDLFSEIWVTEKKKTTDQPLRIADDAPDQAA